MLGAVRPSAKTPSISKVRIQDSLNAVFGSDKWASLLESQNMPPEDIVALYAQEIMDRAHGNNLYVCWHGVYKRYRGGLKYHIVFVTRHREGVRLINDAFRKETGDVYATTASQQTLKLDFDEVFTPPVERPQESRIQELTESLLEIGRAQPNHKWIRKDLQFESMIRRFGDFSWTEHRQAIDSLVQRPKPPRLIAVGVSPKTTGRIITNNDTEMQFQI
jgi:hypothetical protein